MSEKPSVLFVCVHNAGRSRMAMGWMSHLAEGAVEVRSAGTAPAEQVNPVAVEAMREVGIDITAERPTDPAGQGTEAVRPIRDQIRIWVEGLLAELSGQDSPAT